MGPGVIRADVPSDTFNEFAESYGIEVERPITRPQWPGQTETLIPFEGVDEFDQFARYSLEEGP